MSLEIMQLLVYLILAVSVVFYVVLDGFDLGVGSLQLFAGTDRNRRIFLNSIGPFWDGNEVWLIIIGGVLFVGFPDIYAVIFSGMYIMFMCLLCGIIFRAVAIEFRSKVETNRWRWTWDIVFCLSSTAITFGAGIILGNLLKGVPVGPSRELYYSFGELFTPYTIFMGIFSIFLLAMHANHFLLMKTEDDLYDRVYKWAPWTITLFVVFFLITTLWTWIDYPEMLQRFLDYPVWWLVPIALIGVIIAMIITTHMRYHGFAFLASALAITLLFGLFAIGTFPNIVISSINKEFYSLTLWNASSSSTTLGITLIIAAIGVPIVLAYGWLLYHIFRGKTILHDHSY